jgi:hypothetical protein
MKPLSIVLGGARNGLMKGDDVDDPTKIEYILMSNKHLKRCSYHWTLEK